MAGIRTKWRFLCEGRIPSGDRPGFLPRWNPPNTFTYALGPLKCNSRPRLPRLDPLPRSHTSSLRRSLHDKPLICLPFFPAIDLSVFLHPHRPTDKRFEIGRGGDGGSSAAFFLPRILEFSQQFSFSNERGERVFSQSRHTRVLRRRKRRVRCEKTIRGTRVVHTIEGGGKKVYRS